MAENTEIHGKILKMGVFYTEIKLHRLEALSETTRKTTYPGVFSNIDLAT